MKKLLRKDLKKRKFVYKHENLKFVLKNILNNFNFIKMIRMNASLKLFKLKKNVSTVNLKKRCILTNRKNTSYKSKFSRLALLKLIRFGFIYGTRKMS